VVSGSAADVAGLKVKDRIYAVGEHRFSGNDDFTKFIGSLPSPLIFLVERQGRLSTVNVDVLPAEVAP
jgi:C-terminal processing protease CtpA/Prc